MSRTPAQLAQDAAFAAQTALSMATATTTAVESLARAANESAISAARLEEKQRHLGAGVENISSSVKMGHDAILVAIRESKEELERKIDHLAERIDENEVEIDALSKKVYFFSGGAAVISAFATYLWSKLK